MASLSPVFRIYQILYHIIQRYSNDSFRKSYKISKFEGGEKRKILDKFVMDTHIALVKDPDMKVFRFDDGWTIVLEGAEAYLYDAYGDLKNNEKI